MGKKIYSVPTIKVVEFSIEKGFIGSPGSTDPTQGLSLSFMFKTRSAEGQADGATWLGDNDFNSNLFSR